MAVKGIFSDELRSTDELCHRWARQAFDWPGRKTSSTYRAMQAMAGVVVEPGMAPPMDADVTALEKILSKCRVSTDDGWIYAICCTHYCQGGSSQQKAKRLHIGRTRYYELLRQALTELQRRLPIDLDRATQAAAVHCYSRYESEGRSNMQPQKLLSPYRLPTHCVVPVLRNQSETNNKQAK